jgi:hypothetical protein
MLAISIAIVGSMARSAVPNSQKFKSCSTIIKSSSRRGRINGCPVCLQALEPHCDKRSAEYQVDLDMAKRKTKDPSFNILADLRSKPRTIR